MARDKYVLQTGKKGCDRLEVQVKMIQPVTEEYLTKAGFKKGSVVYDLGCGNGIVTEYLAREVGDSGKVYAVDKSQKH